MLIYTLFLNVGIYLFNYELNSIHIHHFFTPKGIRIPVSSVKRRCPRPLDDGGFCFNIP